MKNLRLVLMMILGLSFSAPVLANVTMPDMSFGGQFRVRYEVSDPQSFTSTDKQQTSDLLLLRTRLWGDAVIPEQNLRVFLQLQDSRVSGSEASVAANSANVDLHQGYLDINKLFGSKSKARVGRQELKYGDQRLISTLEWSNVGRSWDGLKLVIPTGKVQTDLFYTIVNEVADIYQDHKFSGLYSTIDAPKKHNIDFYVLHRHSGDADSTTGNGASLNLSQITGGGLFKGKAGLFDYSGELVFQGGKSAGRDIDAHAYAVTGGINLPTKMPTRLGVAYDFASGDENPNDNEVGTFDPLFPFGHYYQGHADVFSWKNGGDLQAHLKIEPIKGTKVMVSYHNFRLAEAKDAWYNAGGNVITQDATGSSGKDVGDEIDIHVKTTFRKIIKIWFGYAHFTGGDFVKKTAVRNDKDFAFIQGLINFGGTPAK